MTRQACFGTVYASDLILFHQRPHDAL